jgi:hypothetical protein
MLGLFKRKPTITQDRGEHWRSFTADGIAFGRKEADLPDRSVDARKLDNPAVAGFLAQLEDDGRLLRSSGAQWLPWKDVFDILETSEQTACRELLSLPKGSGHVPSLLSLGSLRDPTFDIVVQAWHRRDGERMPRVETRGAIFVDDEIGLLPRNTWELLEQVSRFQNRSAEEHDELSNRRHWGRIRRAAIAVDAHLDNFLLNTVVLTPEKLQIGLRKNESSGSKVVEVVPTFEGSPEGWLEAFDSRGSVVDRYNIPTVGGVVAVEISPNVKTVLENIKRMPGRRVAGARAEAFLVNPFAALGEAAVETIDEAQFMEARDQADLLFERFFAHVEKDALGYPVVVGLRIESPRATGPFETEVKPFDDDVELEHFIRAVETTLERGNQLCAWEGHDFEIMGETENELGLLKAALQTRAKPQVLVSYASIFDLSAYAERVEGIGDEKPFYSPYIAKKVDEEGWFPENIVSVISWIPEGETDAVAVPLTPEFKEQLGQKLDDAIGKGQDSISIGGFPKPISVNEARRILDTFGKVDSDVASGKFDPTNPKGGQPPRSNKHLVIRANIQSIDYQEARKDILETSVAAMALPSGLRRDVELKDHQRSGVAWLQHLFSKSPAHCRGAVLADDMGLGKTLQILTLLAWVFEQDPTLPPALIVAPVSLLENWEKEASKFLVPRTLTVLTAYGDAMAQLRVPRDNIDEQLRKEGLTRFLRPDWLGESNVVLTTYETLRDLEFSFGAVNWSIMVCDEAQRIKNPNAMVTRAAKKQKVRFRIACTGTPVENTLTDLWCLFDYVQPGLLGALNDFGHRYRRPIEAETEDEKSRVEELRELIAPQIKRRTKKEVAKDLPERHDPPVELPLSPHQRTLYAKAVDLFKKRDQADGTVPFKNHLGLLHYLRLICTDPREIGHTVFKPEPLVAYRARSPKLDWLLGKLQEIKIRDEKVIIFCEFREIQRMLRHYIEESFGFAPVIINGDTSASSQHVASRQKRIDNFQQSPAFGIIILSPVAVGFGVNIQEANHVIHYTRHWNPAKEDQATDRAHRIGQTREVFVYCPVVVALDFLTFDVKLHRLLGVKRELAMDMLNGAGDVGPADFNIEDMVPAKDRRNLSPPITIGDVVSMEWEFFECFVATLWLKQGFKTVYKTPPQDGGVDVVAISGNKGVLIQCKTSSIDGHEMGWEAVKDVVAGAAAYQRKHPGIVFEKVCATNQFFNGTAKKHAKLNDVTVVEQGEFEKLLQQHRVSKLEVESFLLTVWGSAA